MIGRFEPRHAINHVVLVGVGGTGSALARSVARIIYDMSQRGMHTPRFTLIDPDHVEEKNVGRQAGFAPADVGHNKAMLLSRRFNLALGLDSTAIPEPFDPERHPNGPGTLLLGCVDNHEARRALARAGCLWGDSGNHLASGQFVIGDSSDRETVLDALARMETQGGVIHHLPNAALVFPELLEPNPEPGPAPGASCGDLMDQALLINDAVAVAAASYVFRLLHRIPLTSFISFVSLEAIRPVPVSDEEIRTYL
ncbi:MAG: ThiF family adenylyltransferase [Anaerolineae bacterium]|nr:ThiF family adenylyltransferase [Anaerolineae bacterium]